MVSSAKLFLRKSKECFTNLSASKKIQFVLASVLTLALIVTIPLYAWFSYRKSLITAAKIDHPTSLTLAAGYNEDVTCLDLSHIQVSEDSDGSEYYVISVIRDTYNNSYKLQLAHTTNIPFTYTLYYAKMLGESEETSEGIIKATDSSGKEYVTLNASLVGNVKDKVSGEYKNDTNDDGIADESDSYYDYSYKNNDATMAQVQKNARPLYWQARIDSSAWSQDEVNLENGLYVDFFILEVSWKAKDKLKNDKETDIVYITVGSISND